jgi:hypothetical protein
MDISNRSESTCADTDAPYQFKGVLQVTVQVNEDYVKVAIDGPRRIVEVGRIGDELLN